MNTLTRWIGAAVVAIALPAALLAQKPALNIRVGLWETTTTMRIGGQMPKFDTGNLTPEQKARMEAMMKQMMGTPRTTTAKACLTEKDLERPDFMGKEEPDCKSTVTKNTATTLDMTEVCTGDNPRTMHMHFEATSPTSVTGTISSTDTNKGRTMTVDGTLVSKWVSADCGKDKDTDK